MTILAYKPINKGNLVGVFDVALQSGFVIYGAMLCRKGDAEWIGFPGKPFQGADGQTKYTKLIEIPDRILRDKFSAQVIAALVEAGHLTEATAADEVDELL